MRAALFSTVSVAALFAFAGVASADDTFSGVGQLHLGGGTSDASFFGGKVFDDPFLYGGKAQGYWPLSPDVHLQVDLFANQTDDLLREQTGSLTIGDGDSTRFGGAVHLLHPLEKRARFGLAGSIWNTDVFTSDGGESSLDIIQTDATYGLVAAEAQFFGTDWTVTGQAGIFATMSCDVVGLGCPGVARDGTFIRGKVRYFLNDNTALGVEALHMWGSVDDDLFSGKTIPINSTTWVVDAEHRFRDSPFAGFISLSQEHDVAEAGFNIVVDTKTVAVGVKFYFGQDTLRSNDQTGAAIDTPQFGNALENSGASSVLGFF